MSHLKTAKKYAYVGIVQMVEVEVWLVDCRLVKLKMIVLQGSTPHTVISSLGHVEVGSLSQGNS